MAYLKPSRDPSFIYFKPYKTLLYLPLTHFWLQNGYPILIGLLDIIRLFLVVFFSIIMVTGYILLLTLCYGLNFLSCAKMWMSVGFLSKNEMISNFPMVRMAHCNNSYIELRKGHVKLNI
jgi:hypothetical protein